MKIYSAQAEKWLRMNKAATFEIFEGERKSPLYIYSEQEATIETAVLALAETIKELPNGEYKLRAKQHSKAPNSSYVHAELIVGEQPNYSSQETPKNTSTMSDTLSMQALLFEKEKELIHKEYERKELARRVYELDAKFNKVLSQMKQFEEHFNECMEGMNNGKSSNTMQDTIKSGVNSLVNHGTRVAMDRFGNPKI
jgi:hypothetical protein